MNTSTRCCSCGDEVVPGSDVYAGAQEGETACSMLCRYRILADATWSDWPLSREEPGRSEVRVELLRAALLHDPTIFGESTIDVRLRGNGDPAWAATIPVVVHEDVVVLEIVSGEWCGEVLNLRWGDILDAVVHDD